MSVLSSDLLPVSQNRWQHSLPLTSQLKMVKMTLGWLAITEDCPLYSSTSVCNTVHLLADDTSLLIQAPLPCGEGRGGTMLIALCKTDQQHFHSPSKWRKRQVYFMGFIHPPKSQARSKWGARPYLDHSVGQLCTCKFHCPTSAPYATPNLMYNLKVYRGAYK